MADWLKSKSGSDGVDADADADADTLGEGMLLKAPPVGWNTCGPAGPLGAAYSIPNAAT